MNRYPYIKVLPDPTTICKWSHQLRELQDPALVKAANEKWDHFQYNTYDCSPDYVPDFRTTFRGAVHGKSI